MGTSSQNKAEKKNSPKIEKQMSTINPKFKTLEDEISSANKRESGCLVKRSAHGFGVFAKRCFDKGELVFSASCLTESERNVHSIQIDWNKHVLMNLPGRFINHSCNSNVGIKNNDQGAYDFIALRKVEKDEELTWDYCGAEFDQINFKCECGGDNCRKILKGFRVDHEFIRSHCGLFYANYLHSFDANA